VANKWAILIIKFLGQRTMRFSELLGVSQSTVSRRITTLTPVLEEVLADYIPTLEELPTVLHQRRMVATANAAVSPSLPTDTQPVSTGRRHRKARLYLVRRGSRG
jgi:hypothetical protein